MPPNMPQPRAFSGRRSQGSAGVRASPRRQRPWRRATSEPPPLCVRRNFRRSIHCTSRRAAQDAKSGQLGRPPRTDPDSGGLRAQGAGRRHRHTEPGGGSRHWRGDGHVVRRRRAGSHAGGLGLLHRFDRRGVVLDWRGLSGAGDLYRSRSPSSRRLRFSGTNCSMKRERLRFRSASRASSGRGTLLQLCLLSRCTLYVRPLGTAVARAIRCGPHPEVIGSSSRQV